MKDMDEIETSKSSQLVEIRTVKIDGERWVCLTDVRNAFNLIGGKRNGCLKGVEVLFRDFTDSIMHPTKIYCIYKVTNKVNGKVYIGKTSRFKTRRLEHIYTKQDNSLFHEELKKFGKENFEWEIIEDNIKSPEKANERERYWINEYRAFIHLKDSEGYNMTRGGDGANGWNVRKVASYSLNGDLLETFDSITACAKRYGIGSKTEICKVCESSKRSCHKMMFRYFSDEENLPNKIEPFERTRRTHRKQSTT